MSDVSIERAKARGFFDFAKAVLTPDQSLYMGSIGATRGSVGRGQRTHRAVVCHVVYEDSADLNAPQLLIAHCVAFYEVPATEMNFDMFIHKLPPSEFIGCNRDMFSMDAIARANRTPMPVTNFDFTANMKLVHPRSMEFDDELLDYWLPTIKCSAGAFLYNCQSA